MLLKEFNICSDEQCNRSIEVKALEANASVRYIETAVKVVFRAYYQCWPHFFEVKRKIFFTNIAVHISSSVEHACRVDALQYTMLRGHPYTSTNM